LTKSRITKQLAEARQVALVAELEKANAQLHAELDTARLKLVEVEHREQEPPKTRVLKKTWKMHVLHMMLW
jgi:hypothetical protein